MSTQRLEEGSGGVRGGGKEREWEWERERERARTHAGEKERGKMLWLLLLYVFSSTWACPMKIGLSQECCLSYLKFSLWSSDLPLTFLCSIFTGFSLPCLLATAILDSFSLFYLPNNFILSILKKMSRPVQRRREDAIMSAKSLPVWTARAEKAGCHEGELWNLSRSIRQDCKA